MYLVSVLCIAFFFFGISLFTFDLAKRKKSYENKWLNDNVWKDASEWEAYQTKHTAHHIDLSL
jgi:hypothetical protein